MVVDFIHKVHPIVSINLPHNPKLQTIMALRRVAPIEVLSHQAQDIIFNLDPMVQEVLLLQEGTKTSMEHQELFLLDQPLMEMSLVGLQLAVELLITLVENSNAVAVELAKLVSRDLRDPMEKMVNR